MNCCGAENSDDDGDYEPSGSGSGSDSDNDSEKDDARKRLAVQEELPAVRALMLPMICIFGGYASMVGPAQQKFKSELRIGQTGEAAMIFTQAAVFVHYGKLIARLGHDVLFGFLSPLKRVYFSMSLVLIGTLIPPLFVFDLHERWIGFVFFSNGLTGIGLGVFECTYLAVITPLGKLTKAWAIMGIPLGFGIVNILGLICTSMGMPVAYIYWYIVATIPLGMYALWANSAGLDTSVEVAHGHGHGAGVKQRGFLSSLMQCGMWFPLVMPHLVAKLCVNFVMENATPVNYYVYNAPKVPLWSPKNVDGLVRHDLFFAVLGVFVMVGDMTSRRIPASLSLNTVSSNIAILIAAVTSSLLGFYLESLAIGVLAWAGIFMAFWGNGLVYGASAKYFDWAVPKEFNLVAYSLWCFAGDLGGIVGGVTVDLIRNWICGGRQYTYECLSHN